MKSQGLKKFKLPDSPGIYFFLGKRKETLYIGRATSLRDRVRSYFGSDLFDTRGPKIVKMIEDVRSIDFRKTDSVLESILLEADLIKKLKPPYNTDDKDDKSFNCVMITNEEFPRILLVRKRELDNSLSANTSKAYMAGPFPEGGKLKIALKIIRKIFPYRDSTCVPNSGKPCFNRQIGFCPGVCTGEITRQEYAKTIRNIQRFFEGKKSSIVRSLAADMKVYAKTQEFEKAAEAKRQLFALQHIADVALVSDSASVKHSRILQNSGIEYDAGRREGMRIEAFDVAHTAGKETVGVMTVVQGGEADKSQYKMFRVRSAKAGDDVGALKEILGRRFKHPEWGIPDIVVIDGGKAQLNAAQRLLAGLGMKAVVVSVVKDDRHRPHHLLGDSEYIHRFEAPILLANSEAHRFAVSFHRRRRDRIDKN
ncbi:MAG TPA: hypothetical protein VJH94_03905 [Candidatus Paceibacterota bacterium]